MYKFEFFNPSSSKFDILGSITHYEGNKYVELVFSPSLPNAIVFHLLFKV